MTTFTSEASSYNCSLCELIRIYADSELFQKVASLDVVIWYQREATFLGVFFSYLWQSALSFVVT